MGLCCLSKGCIGSPKLLNAPYLASTLDAQLNAMNRAFCSGINKDKDLCLRNSNVCISSLFRIYEEHYIKYAIEKKWQITPTNEEDKYDDNVNGALLGYVYHFANKKMRNKLSYPILNGYGIKYIEFDWRLSIHKSKRIKMIMMMQRRKKVMIKRFKIPK